MDFRCDLADLRTSIEKTRRDERLSAIKLLRRGSRSWMLDGPACLLFVVLFSATKDLPGYLLVLISALIGFIWLQARDLHKRLDAVTLILGVGDQLGLEDGTKPGECDASTHAPSPPPLNVGR